MTVINFAGRLIRKGSGAAEARSRLGIRGPCFAIAAPRDAGRLLRGRDGLGGRLGDAADRISAAGD